MKPDLKLAEELVELGLIKLETADRRGARLNTFGIQLLGKAAILFGFNSKLVRIESLLDRHPLTLEHVITNVEIDRSKPGKSPLPTCEALAKQFPAYDGDYLSRQMKTTGSIGEHCQLRDYKGAYSICGDDTYYKAMVTGFQLMQGAFEEAISAMNEMPDRWQGLWVVLAIELQRKNFKIEANRVRESIISNDSTGWDIGLLALAAGGRIPWPDYPIFDW